MGTEVTILISLTLGFTMGFLPLWLFMRSRSAEQSVANTAYADMHDLTEKFAHMNAQLLNNQTIMMGWGQQQGSALSTPEPEPDLFDMIGGSLSGAGSSD